MNTLIIKQVRRKLNKPHCSIGDLKRKITNATAWFIACLVFIGVCGVYNIYSNATDVYADYTISMTSSGAQNIDVVPMVDGSTGTNIGVDSINVTTDCKAGYNFSLSTSTTNNNLYLNGSSSNNTAGKYFTPANGTSTLANSSNTWGYYYNSAAPTTAPTSSNIFLPVPKSNAAAASIITPTASATNINDSFNIYYGVAVGNGMAPGTYKMANSGAIIYYTTMAEACLPYTVVFNPTSTAGGTSVTGTGTMASQTIQPGVTTNLTTNSFTAPAGYEFAGWNTRQNGTGTSYTDGQSVTDLTTGGTSITLYAQWDKVKLYDEVAKMSKGKQTNDTNTTTGIKVNPTAPTSSVTVSPNSGVYEYDSSVFGADTDGTKSDSTKATIYYYRGILDSYGNTATYGSAGLADAYPNYVVLSASGTKATTDTCWRIIRTTGSGGVKMIYNGLWTGSTCANSTTAAMISSPVATSTFDGAASNTTTSRQIVRVGYTYNNTYASTSYTTGVAFDTVMGSNADYSINNTDSTIKGNVETWFNNTLSSYSGMLEPNAGYCNDRLGYTSGTASTLTTSIRPYTTSTTSGATYNSYFAGYQRNLATTQSPSLGCSSARSTVDVYSTDTSKGGNGQLGAPVGLLTADEASFAGSGSSTAGNGSGYSATSYLRNGSAFWTMTPYYRYSRYAYNIVMNTNGYLGSSRIDTANGIRPVVSLKEGTAIDSGTGIATDPWVIKGKTMQSVTSDDLAELMPNEGDTTTLPDARDGQEYTIAKLADGKYWMTTNLNLAGGTKLDSDGSDVPAGYTQSNPYYTLPASTTISSGTDVQSDQFSSNTTAYVFNTGNNTTTCNSSTPCNSYYSWLAATAGGKGSSGSSVTSNGYNAAYSICPKGWRLPTSTTSNASATTSPNWKTGDFYALATAYGANLESNENENSVTFYNNAGSGTTPNFLLAGYYNSSSFYNGGSDGYYWSSTSHSSSYAYRLRFHSSYVDVAFNGFRRYGLSVRCLFGEQ